MRYILTIRYGVLNNTSDFISAIDSLKKGDHVVVRSSRGIEFGKIIAKVKEVPDNFSAEDIGEVLRKATSDDYEKQMKIHDEMVPVEFKFCQKKIKEHKLLMKLASVEHLYGTKKIIFYYLANGRVDFRDLVKDLAKEYQARIEMKQIGVRDEARLLADYEHCGRELCCRSFLKNLEPVTMKMAKNQKATLDPSKISGRCGRLMCCLRYEDKVYEDLKHNMPKRGSFIKTAKGTGEVINHDILRQLVTIELDNGSKCCISVSEIMDKAGGLTTQKEKTCNHICEKGCDAE
ncbi:MAG: PSP1 domain-containing protein [Candidatus Loosdrechtia sp.]|uniref:PSP1 domain-containing protein n=1 Tax=Candidatus Loosdrechtia sp. TaxID=3101272 RepID=UPI003A7274A9|nr:MAG: regulatory iron-sulfur-containing complex subunit RicT [Candidatus Jettenia sp. AMX2]